MSLSQTQKDDIVRIKGDIKSLDNIIQRRTRWANAMPPIQRALEKIRISDFRSLRDDFKRQLKEIKNG